MYFYQLGLRLQLHALLEDGVKLGFRDRTGIDLVNEVTPIYPALHRLLRQDVRAARVEQCR